MSDPTRYSIVADYQAPWAKMHEFRSGDWVKWDDYARLKAENKRLLAAGNAMDNAISELDPQRLERSRYGQMTDAEYVAVIKWRTTKDPTYNRA